MATKIDARTNAFEPNPKLAAAIKAAGGVVVVAFHCKKSVQAIYSWRKAGRVFDLVDAITLQGLAKDGGYVVDLPELAGIGEGATAEPTPNERGVAKRRTSPSSRCLTKRDVSAPSTATLRAVTPTASLEQAAA